MTDQEETYKLWKIRKTILQLCHDRGYLVAQDELDETLEQFKEAFGDKPSRRDLTILVEHSDDPTDQMFVFFPDEPKIGIQVVRNYCQRMALEKVNRAIFVAEKAITVAAKQLANTASLFFLEYFLQTELLFNLTVHEYVPEHIVLTPGEKQGLLAKYRIKENQLMIMKVADPVARYLGLRRGQVVKIIRNSDSAGKYVTYRLVF